MLETSTSKKFYNSLPTYYDESHQNCHEYMEQKQSLALSLIERYDEVMADKDHIAKIDRDYTNFFAEVYSTAQGCSSSWDFNRLMSPDVI